MKTMTCNQLGGAFDRAFTTNTFEEIAEMSKKHGGEMFMSKDEAHLAAMNKMQKLMQEPEAMAKWFSDKRKEFDALPTNL